MKPVDGPVEIVIQPPGSKSITNRALLCAALAKGNSLLTGVLDSDDTRVMMDGLRQAGIVIHHDKVACTAKVEGAGKTFPVKSGEIDVEGSGTTIRFLTAALCAVGGSYRLDGIERMRSRPIGDLVDALRQLGGSLSCDRDSTYPPVQIESDGLAGGSASVAGNISSQFLSGLLMAAPLADNPVQLKIEGELVSRPYVEMTIAVMKSFGVLVEHNENFDEFLIQPQSYQACEYAIEPDASAASYFWAAAAIAGGSAKVTGLNRQSLQGDVGFVSCLGEMGCEVVYESDSISVMGKATKPIKIDMSEMSDTVQTLAAVAMFVDGTTTVTNVAHNRVKETDRISDLAVELRKLGAEVVESHDGLEITPGKLRGAEIETYNDHRMAMSLALIGLKLDGVFILDPECVSKTFPNYFAVLEESLSK